MITGPSRWLRLVVVGLLGGFFSGMFGVGGGIIGIPLLVTLLHFDQRRAAATALASIVPAAVVGAIGYAVGGQVALLAAALIGVGGVGGSLIGSRLLRRLSLSWLRWLFLALIVVVAVRMLVALPERGGELVVDVPTGAGLVLLGIGMGIASGLFGIGGGVLVIPVLIAVFGAGDLLARGTSLAAMVVTATVGSVTNYRAGLMLLKESAVIGVAAMATSTAGVAVAFLLSPLASSVLFAALMAISAVQLVLAARRDRRAR